MGYWSIAIFIHMFAIIISQIADKGFNGISYVIGFIAGWILMSCSKIKM